MLVVRDGGLWEVRVFKKRQISTLFLSNLYGLSVPSTGYHSIKEKSLLTPPMVCCKALHRRVFFIFLVFFSASGSGGSGAMPSVLGGQRSLRGAGVCSCPSMYSESRQRTRP